MNKIVGNSHHKDFFKFYEEKIIHIEKVYEVLMGKVAGCIFRNIIANDICSKITDNFWKSPSLKQRSDNVPAFYVGAYHYEKELSAYLAQAHCSNKSLPYLFSNTTNIFDEFISSLAIYLESRGITLRLAEHENKKAGHFLMRSWSNSGSYALKPHEDLAQCGSLKQKDFEIQRVRDYEVVAVNMCLENGEDGNLHYWNIQPNNLTRKRLGIEETGYPYPENLLEDFQKIILPIKKGDIYCFNGRNIHAVDELNQANRNRLTLSFLMGFINSKTVVYWT